jgi:hypothetical protein
MHWRRGHAGIIFERVAFAQRGLAPAVLCEQDEPHYAVLVERGDARELEPGAGDRGVHRDSGDHELVAAPALTCAGTSATSPRPR